MLLPNQVGAAGKVFFSPETLTPVKPRTRDKDRRVRALTMDLEKYRFVERQRRRSPRVGQETQNNTSKTLKGHLAVSSGVQKSKLKANKIRPGPSTGISPNKRPSASYADPSRYAHLSPLVDILEPNLILVFVGVNPGISTAKAGHGYAHPSNRFWHLLHVSGLTPDRRLSPTEDRDLPRLYQMGQTNIVSRPTKDQSQLSKEEMIAGAGILEEKFRKWRPEAVCLVGKGIWEAVFRYKHGRAQKKEEFKYGWQDESENMGVTLPGTTIDEGTPWPGSRLFVATSTSGQAASLKPAEKEAIWRPLGEWVQRRRLEKQNQSE